jgi:hypothetical protein
MINQDYLNRLFPGLLTLLKRQVYESNLVIGKVWTKLVNFLKLDQLILQIIDLISRSFNTSQTSSVWV